MKVKIKKLHEDVVLPAYGKPGDAGMDLVAISKEFNQEFGFFEFGTGLAIEIPEGYVGLLFPRSSISKSKFTLLNSVGVIDSGYRGEIKLRFGIYSHFLASRLKEVIDAVDSQQIEYQVGDKIGQLMIIPYPQIEFEEVEELSETERAAGGFGSTGS